MPKKRPSPGGDVLHDMYVVQHLTMDCIRKHFKTSFEALARWLEEAGIPAKPRGGIPTVKTNCKKCGTEIMVRNKRKHRYCLACWPDHVRDRNRKYLLDYDREKLTESTRKASRKYFRTAHGRATGLLRAAKNRAKNCGVPFDITKEWVNESLASGCAATGLPFDLDPHHAGRRAGPWSPSVDRIEPRGPYTEANCRIVCLMFNICRRDWSDDDVTRMAEALVQRAREAAEKRKAAVP